MNLILVHPMYTCLNIILITLGTNSISIFQSLKREIRYTKFNMVTSNTSYVTINESSIKQYYDKQILYIHTVVHKPIKEMHATYKIYKCKDYYVDCYNVVTYDMSELCSKLKLLLHFTLTVSSSMGKSGKFEESSCPIYGEFYRNVSIDGDAFGSVFSLSTENYWERYWRTQFTIYNENHYNVLTMYLDFYFIQFRSGRRRNH